MITETQLLANAWQVQDACNLSGVAHSFSRAMTDLRAACPDQGTEFYNQHPVSQLYADKIRQLAIQSESGLSSAFNTAYNVVYGTKLKA